MSDPAITAEARIVESLDKFQRNWTRMLDPDTSSTDQAASIQHSILFFTYAVLLSEIESFDRDRADWLAGWIDDQLEDGGAGEVVYAWRQGTKPDVLVGQESLDEVRRELATTREERRVLWHLVKLSTKRRWLETGAIMDAARRDWNLLNSVIEAKDALFGRSDEADAPTETAPDLARATDAPSELVTLPSDWRDQANEVLELSTVQQRKFNALVEGWGTATQPTPELPRPRLLVEIVPKGTPGMCICERSYENFDGTDRDCPTHGANSQLLQASPTLGVGVPFDAATFRAPEPERLSEEEYRSFRLAIARRQPISPEEQATLDELSSLTQEMGLTSAVPSPEEKQATGRITTKEFLDEVRAVSAWNAEQAEPQVFTECLEPAPDDLRSVVDSGGVAWRRLANEMWHSEFGNNAGWPHIVRNFGPLTEVSRRPAGGTGEPQ